MPRQHNQHAWSVRLTRSIFCCTYLALGTVRFNTSANRCRSATVISVPEDCSRREQTNTYISPRTNPALLPSHPPTLRPSYPPTLLPSYPPTLPPALPPTLPPTLPLPFPPNLPP